MHSLGLKYNAHTEVSDAEGAACSSTMSKHELSMEVLSEGLLQDINKDTLLNTHNSEVNFFIIFCHVVPLTTIELTKKVILVVYINGFIWVLHVLKV